MAGLILTDYEKKRVSSPNFNSKSNLRTCS